MAFTSGQWGPDTFIDSDGTTTLIGATVTASGYVCTVDELGNLTVTGPADDSVTVTVTPAEGSAYTVALPVAPLVSELETVQALAAAAETPAGATAKATAAATAAQTAAATDAATKADAAQAAAIAAAATAASGTYVAMATGLDNTGATDVKTALQAQLDALGAVLAASGVAGGTLILPRGTFKISGTLTVPNKVTVEGQGRNTTIILNTSLAAGAWMIRQGTSAEVAFHCRLVNLVIDCAGNADIGVYSTNVDSNSGLDNVLIRRYRTRGVKYATTDTSGPSTNKLGAFRILSLELLPGVSGVGSVGVELVDPMTTSTVIDVNVNMDVAVGVADAAVLISGSIADSGYVGLTNVRSENHANTVRFTGHAKGSAVHVEGRNCSDAAVKITGTGAVTLLGVIPSGTTVYAVNDTNSGETVKAGRTYSTAPIRAGRVVAGRLPSRPTVAIAESIPRVQAMGSQAVLATGRASFVAVYLHAGEVITGMTWVSGSTAGAGITNVWGVLVTPGGAQLGITNDDGAAGFPATTVKSLTFASPITITASGFYYLGLVVAGTTMPTLVAIAGNGTAMTSASLAPVLAYNDTAHTGLTNPASAPATWTLGSTSATVPYALAS